MEKALGSRVRESGLIKFLGQEADDADVKNFFVESVVDALIGIRSANAQEIKILQSVVQDFLADYDISVDASKLSGVCTKLAESAVEEKNAASKKAPTKSAQQAGKGKKKDPKKKGGDSDDEMNSRPALSPKGGSDQEEEPTGKKGKAKGAPAKAAQTKGKPKKNADLSDEDEDEPSKGKKNVQKKGKGKGRKDDEEDEEEEEKPKGKKPPQKGGKPKGKKDESEDEVEEIEEEKPKGKKQPPQKGKVKGKKGEDEEENEMSDEEKPKAKGKQKQATQQGKKGAKVQEADEDEESEEEKPKKGKQNQQQGKKGGKPAAVDEDSEEEKPKGKKQPQKGNKGKGKKTEESEDEEEEPKAKTSKGKKPAAQQKKGKKAESEDEMDVDEDENEEPKPKGKQSKAPQGKKGAKPRVEDEEESDEEKPKAKGKQKQAPQQGKKGAKVQEADEDEESEEEKPKKGKNQQQGKKGGKAAAVDEDSEEETPQKGKAAQAQKAKKAVPKYLPADDDEDVDMEDEPSPAPSPKLPPQKEKEKAAEEKPAAKPTKVEEKPVEKVPETPEEEVTDKLDKLSIQKPATKSKDKKKDKKGKQESKPATKENENKPDAPFSLEQERLGSESMSNDIKVEKFDINYPGRVLFKDALLQLFHGRKYGLVAPNGAGKSTLLNYIAQRKNEFIAIPKHFDILYVEQEVIGDETSALDSVVAADAERTRLMKEEKRILALLDKESEDSDEEDLGSRLAEVHSRLEEMEAFSAEARASSILSGLQFTEEMKKKATKDFSGGWRMRIALARALFRRPTLLLLDEPTNHLDLFAVIWLETYLQKWKNTLLVVSHDQDFLDNVATDIIHVYQEKLHYYKGNYDHFKRVFTDTVNTKRVQLEKRKKLIKQAQQQKSKKQDQSKQLAKAKDRVKVIRNKQNKNQKKDEEKNQAAVDELLEEIPRDYEVEFSFPDPEMLAPPIILVNDAAFGYPDRPQLFHDLSFGIDMKSRIALVGPNGTGKSTLLKLMTGELEPTEGTITRNRKLIVGKFTQHFVDKLNMNQNPVEYLHTHFTDYKAEQLRGMLGRFGLTGQTHLRPISSLSGGQKSRVVFTEICMRYPHLLFLDEPTNHLDIESVDALAEALNEFEGGLILVSHDARLIREVCADIWICGDNTVTIYDGDFDQYREELVEEFEEKERLEEERRKEKEDERRKKREDDMKQKEKQAAERQARKK
eukprot:TRINITY_DN303_c0_g1_i2.p1 TRINITY_DN303_c0_g1~~TRINITY_DN303_c0_g1_i2.p1  ORF type:complete len:1208 (-),score=596.96 TRINITY_DN303_c0_g1_i2:88-3711(-)